LKYFGTDGIRGKVGGSVINETFFHRLGLAVAQFLKERHPNKPLTAVIGRDTRASGEWLAKAAARGLCEENVHLFDIGVVPTPAVANAVLHQNADLGVVITASHNPCSDNGIKFFNAQGQKFTEADEAAVEALLEAIPANPPATCEDCQHQQCSHPLNGLGLYTTAMKAQMHQHCLKGWKVVLDTANGATHEASAEVLRHFGAEVIQIGNAPDGENINDGLGSEHPEQMAALVREHGANLGIAHDGDGDRLILADAQGQVVDGDQVLGLLALHAHQQKRLTPPVLVTTVQSNMGLDKALEAAGIAVERAPVGDRNVLYQMLERDALLGGENSGHVICRDASTTGDGLLTAIRVLQAMLESGLPLSDLKTQVTLFPQKTRSLYVQEKRPLENLPALQATMRELEAALAGKGRILVRYSGTEPKIRLLAEAETDAAANAALAKLENAVQTDLVVVDK